MKDCTIKAKNKHTGKIGMFVIKPEVYTRIDKNKARTVSGEDNWNYKHFNEHWDVLTEDKP